MHKLHKSVVALVAVVSVVAGSSAVSFAQGGNNGGGSSPTGSNIITTSGPCADVVAPEGNFFVYPISNDKYPGSVATTIGLTSSFVPYAQSVCTDPGYTVQSKTVTGGIQQTFYYNGIKSIDMKYVAGKTDIRVY